MPAESLPVEPYLDRAAAELADLASQGVLACGSAFSQVLLVKGEPGPAERAGGGLLSGADGAALVAAFTRIGYREDDLAGVAAFEVGPAALAGQGDPSPLDPALAALAVETFDPELVVALDGRAARVLEGAWGLGAPIEPGAPVAVRGRRVAALGGFEAALSDPRAKQVMWARIKQLPPLGAPL